MKPTKIPYQRHSLGQALATLPLSYRTLGCGLASPQELRGGSLSPFFALVGGGNTPRKPEMRLTDSNSVPGTLEAVYPDCLRGFSYIKAEAGHFGG